MPVLDLDGVKKTIPHREPILLVDEVISFISEMEIEAVRYFPKNDPVFQGHFPGHAILPGVLGVEALAQASALLVNLTLNKDAESTLFYFMGIEKVKFKAPIHPEDTVTLHVTQEKRVRDIYRFSGVVKKNGDVCTEAIFTAKLIVK